MDNIYTTISGDTWDRIAKEVYETETYTSFLMENNQDKLDNFVFPAGVKLIIKDKPKKASILPEWRT